MSSSVEEQLGERIRNAPLEYAPFPHLRIANVFPPEYYREMVANFPSAEHLGSLQQERGTQGYPDRFALGLKAKRLARLPAAQRDFWTALARWMLTERFLRSVMTKFAPFVRQRFPGEATLEMGPEALLVSDRTGYSLGPHTDSPTKLLSMLFYLPQDDAIAAHGTSLYVPREEGFACERGLHYDFGGFRRVTTVPFLPNTMLAFPKSSICFHGVEPITEPGVQRTMLLYDVRLARMPPGGMPG